MIHKIRNILTALYNKVLFNFWYKIEIFGLGGKAKFILRKVTPKKIPKVVKTNARIHLSCVHSLANKGFCTLPCLWCKKFKGKNYKK